MTIPQYYYRLKPIAIDVSDVNEIKKYNRELGALSDISEQLERLKRAYDYAQKERADIIINAIPEVKGVVELSVFHLAKRRIFSKTVKQNCFSLCATKYESDGSMTLYFYDTANFDEVTAILSDYIEKQKSPAFDGWQRKHF